MPLRAPPTLETPRLVLRPHAVCDLPDCLAMWADPAVVGFIGDGQPHTAEQVWARLLRYAGCWSLLGYGYWAVRERESGCFVGDVGFQNAHRAAEPTLPDAPEIGWVLAPSAQGRGYAAEAVAAALAWADRALASETFCIIRPAHGRSIRIAEAAGYARTGSVRLAGQPIDVFSRPQPFHDDAAAPKS